MENWLPLKLYEFQAFVDCGHFGEVTVVMEKVKVMFDGDLCDETIDGPSNGDALPTTVEIQIGRLFITKNWIKWVVELLSAEIVLER